MKNITVFFLGRSIEGIIADAHRSFPEMIGEILIISRDGDTLPLPDGFQTIPVSEFKPAVGVKYTVVANGGTAQQLAPVLLRLAHAGNDLRVIDLQRDGMKELA